MAAWQEVTPKSAFFGQNRPPIHAFPPDEIPGMTHRAGFR
jgi:hypothetical protein